MRLTILYESIDIDKAIEKVKAKLRKGMGLRTSIFVSLREMGITEKISQWKLLGELEKEMRRRAAIVRKRKAAEEKARKHQSVPDWFFT